jgi:hypothetical protein
VLLWADPWLSAKVFGAGLYALICFRQVAVGEQQAPMCPVSHALLTASLDLIQLASGFKTVRC